MMMNDDNDENNHVQMQYNDMFQVLHPKCMYTVGKTNNDVGFQQKTGWSIGGPPNEHLLKGAGVLHTNDYLKVANMICESKKCNCDSIRVPIHSNLNLSKWAEYLHLYNDSRLLHFLTYGFPLGDNHVSTTKFAAEVQAF